VLYLVTGDDIIRKRFVIAGITRKWGRKPEVLWADEVEESWLLSYMADSDHLILRNCSRLTDLTGERIKDLRDKHIVFETEEMPAGRLRRRLKRLGKSVDCKIGGRDVKENIAIVAAKIGLPPVQ
jgi:hypothetical protein